jgi:hypothetical protein
MTGDGSTWMPTAWHEHPRYPIGPIENSKSNIAFVAGRIAFVRLYHDGNNVAARYKPDRSYDYQWDPN